MTPKSFSGFANLFSEPVLLVSTTGAIAASNAAAREEFAVEPQSGGPVSLLNLVTDTPQSVIDYLQRCSTTNEAVFGSLAFRTANQEIASYRCDGARLDADEAGQGAFIGIRCRRKDASTNAFAALNSKIEELAREITERRRAEARLAFLLREQETLFQELHHRVKNNIQFLISLIRLHESSATDQTSREMCIELRNRVTTMGLMHKQLYNAETISRIDLGEYVDELCKNLQATYELPNVGIRTNVADLPVEVDKAIPLGLIITELVSNALKHAFPDGRVGEIGISLQPHPNRCFELTVSDNGVGIDVEFPPRKRNSLVLQLIDALSGQINGNVQVSREGGTKFTVVAPLTERKSAASS